ncbi:MAG: aldo/keto reductase [Thermoproteota archaeon]|jgi:diketogulonate reductase-like aldo/keto reductase
MEIKIEYKELGKTGEKIPALGLGTWGIGGFSYPDYSNDELAIEIIRFAVEIGMNFIDTAEMYGAGHSEELVGEAIKGIREKVFIATKVLPTNFRYEDVIKACERSLRRLKTSYIDLYQLHWPNPSIPIKETMRAMEKLANEGKIRYIGISNFSVEETIEAMNALSKYEIVSNQVEYSLLVRDIEKDLLDFCRKNKITVIAYSPLARGELLKGKYYEFLSKIGKKYNKTAAQVALNWLIIKENVVAIPKAFSKAKIVENMGAYGWKLSDEDLKAIDEFFK